jgi:hypothetical protein
MTTVTKLRQDNGNQTFTLPASMHIVTITNSDPGIHQLEIEVNGYDFHVRKLDDNETRIFDIGAAMYRGDNTVTLIPKGRKGDSADVIISDH